MTFLPLVKAIAAHCSTVRRWVALCEADALPLDSGIPGLVSYEAWIGAQNSDYQWPEFDERLAAALCYTSGTTGDPKGVLYSHRSTTLHAYAGALPDATGLSSRDCTLPVVPMFHVNAWGVPYAAAMTGAKVVWPGPALDGKSVYELMESEGVTCAAGVPTVWLALLNHLHAEGKRFSTLQRTSVGGSACPPAMIEAFHQLGVEVLHGWGMTEMSPLGTVCRLKGKQLTLPWSEQLPILATQGRAVFGVDMKIVDPQGKELPWDGASAGDLLVRGPWIVSHYFKHEQEKLLIDGWFHTGDVASIDPDGFLQITDRSKDVIKSGGEWISSIEVENIAMAHPAVAMAACIAMPHEKWAERPLLVIVKNPGSRWVAKICCLSTKARLPSGRFPMTWCSSTASRSVRPARCRKICCASAFAIIGRRRELDARAQNHSGAGADRGHHARGTAMGAGFCRLARKFSDRCWPGALHPGARERQCVRCRRGARGARGRRAIDGVLRRLHATRAPSALAGGRGCQFVGVVCNRGGALHRRLATLAGGRAHRSRTFCSAPSHAHRLERRCAASASPRVADADVDGCRCHALQQRTGAARRLVFEWLRGAFSIDWSRGRGLQSRPIECRSGDFVPAWHDPRHVVGGGILSGAVVRARAVFARSGVCALDFAGARHACGVSTESLMR